MTSDAYVVFEPTRPELVIKHLSSKHLGRCYSESRYEVVSQRKLSADDLKRLADCRLLGFGQAYDVEKEEEFTEEAPPVVVDRHTGKQLDEAPTAYDGRPITQAHPYTYYRVVVRRICDSGD